ncbi:MAG: hypothetical protein QM802_00730 [Agriterribacter sp.]
MYKKVSLIASAALWVLLPKCSACLMAYMGIFSALGLGKLINQSYTLPVIQLLLALNLVASLYLAIKKKQYFFAALSLACALIFILNKIYLESMTVNIVTGIVLVTAALWVRLPGIRKKECLFNTPTKASC